MDVLMPQLGETVAEGTVSQWFKAVGESVAAGDNLFEIETDKVVMEVQAIESGVLAEIRVPVGQPVPVGTTLAVIAAAGAAAAKPAASPAPNGHAANGHDSNGHALRAMEPFREVATPEQRYGSRAAPLGLKITPLARRLVAQAGIDIEALAREVSSRGGRRIGRDDVAAFRPASPAVHTSHPSVSAPAAAAPTPVAPSGAISPAPAESYEQIPAPGPVHAPDSSVKAPAQPRRQPGPDSEVFPLNRIRRRTGENLAASWQQIPHVLQAVEADFGRVDKVRRKANDANAARWGFKLTYLPFIARAVCLAIRDYPQVNATYDGDRLLIHKRIHLGIAVDLAHDGLMVPVVRNADDLNLVGIARSLDRLAKAARDGKLTPGEIGGATYSLTNSGTFGTLITAPIVNPPEVAILSTDGVRKRPVVREDEDGDRLGIGLVGVLAQSFDHRAFDGAYSAAFLDRIRKLIETRDWAAEIA